jgi:hypothetical protein
MTSIFLSARLINPVSRARDLNSLVDNPSTSSKSNNFAEAVFLHDNDF